MALFVYQYAYNELNDYLCTQTATENHSLEALSLYRQSTLWCCLFMPILNKMAIVAQWTATKNHSLEALSLYRQSTLWCCLFMPILNEMAIVAQWTATVARPPDKSVYWKTTFFISHPKHML